MTLGDEVEVWPGTWAARPAARVGSQDLLTIGFERAHNRALEFTDRDAFVEDAIASIGSKPPNVELIVGLNRGPLLEQIGNPSPLSPRAVEVAIAEGAVLVDARTNEQFDEAHIPGAISASAYETGFATKVGRVVPGDRDLIVVADSDGYELEAAEQLASVGLPVRGYLHGGMTAWRSEGRPVKRIEMIDPGELAERLDGDDGENGFLVLDVRDADEFAEGHIPPVHIPGDLPAQRRAAQGQHTPPSAAAASGVAWRRRCFSARALSASCTSPTAGSAPGSARVARLSRDLDVSPAPDRAG
jgi:rhodanese-related sulfurtransferase